ncbi:hypothetical protein ACKKBF_B00015 [Auxenochlorella protothecoides x Auxenochlorella symbiontica]
MVPYRQDLADPVAFASNVACAQAAAAAGLWDGAFAAFASVTAVGGFPAQLQVASVGLPDPPSGDVAVTLGTPPLATPVRLGIEVERAVTRLSVALSLPGQAAVARVLVAAAVDGATNASGGEEPSRATFVVVAAAAPARLAEAQALLQPSGPGSAASSAPSPQVADLTLTGGARVVERIAAPLCAETAPEVVLAVFPEVRIVLTSDVATVCPGNLVQLSAKIDQLAGSSLGDLRFSLRPGAGVKSLWPLRSVAAGVQVDAVPDGFALPSASDSAGALGWVLMAGGGLGYGSLAGTLEAARGSARVAPSVLQIPGACEPDFVEATLAGRAFVDENGDGFAVPDEAGLAGAMVALSAGVDARTDAMGHYHITCLAPGRHAIKLDPPPTHPACSLGRCLECAGIAHSGVTAAAHLD